jgi:NTE family protein
VGNPERVKRPDVLVLGGGGTLGEAWLRALLAGLEADTGWDLRESDAFVGTSAGSIVAAVLAAGRRPEAARGVAAEWERDAAAAAGDGGRTPTGEGGRDTAGDSRRTPAGDSGRNFGGAVGLLAGLSHRAGGAALSVAAPFAPLAAAGLEPAGAALRAAVLRRGRPGAREIPQLRRALESLGSEFDGRLRVAAVELRSGRRVMFGAPGAPPARVSEAVLASCAVPWVFRPVTIGGREYVDGGAWSATNLDAAPVRRRTEVLCLNPTASPRLSADRFGAVRAFAGAGAATEALLLRGRGARVRIVAPDAASVEAIGPNLFDARRRAAVEAAAYRQGRALASSA